MSEGYRTFDHTGDLGLEAWAETPERLFALAAEALLAQVAEVGREDPAEARETLELELEADDAEDLFVHWLNTALLEAEIRRTIWTRAVVSRLSRRGLTGRLEGPRLDPLRHTTLREVKAVSHHGLVLELEGRECRCHMVLDL